MNQSLRLILTSTALVPVGITPATAQQITGSWFTQRDHDHRRQLHPQSAA
jgi:hypothetical protein